MTPVLEARKGWRTLRENRHDQWDFFNRPDAAADFKIWRPRVLTADQLTALSFNKDPDVVNIDRIGRKIEGPRSSPFSDEYRRRLQFIELAISKGELQDLNPMGLFIEWAKCNGLQIADEMIGVDSNRYKGEIASLKMQVANLEEENAELRAQLSRVESNNSEFKPKAKLSVYKLILGMAHDKFKFRPVGRTSGVSNIRTCLESQRLSLDDDTIRYHLNEACSLLESDWVPLSKR